jgi:hypothetical protein
MTGNYPGTKMKKKSKLLKLPNKKDFSLDSCLNGKCDLDLDKFADITLTTDETNDLKEVDNAVVRLKIALGELAQQKTALEATLAQAVLTLNEKQKEYVDKVRSLATDHGIDVDDPEKGRWNFNADTGVFNKL